MGMKNKIITIFSALMLGVFACTVTSYAVEGDADELPYETTPQYIETTEYVEPATDSYEDPTEYVTEPVDDYTEPQYPTEDYSYPYVDYTDEVTEPQYYETQAVTYYYDNEPLYWSNSDGEIYVGGGQAVYTIPITTAPSVPLIPSPTSDSNVLSKNDWNDIVAGLNSNDGNNSSGGNNSDDFSFIKKNNAKNDNGSWILFAGILCFILAISGFTYTILSVIADRKKLAYAGVTGFAENKNTKTKNAVARHSKKNETASVGKHAKVENENSTKTVGKRYKD